jgi:hypothetical protein
MPSPRYADHRYAGALRGDPPTGYANSDVPWHIGPTRVDGLAASEPLGPPVVPGRERTYECRFLPDASHDARDHVRRFETVAAYLEYAPDVLTFDPPGGQVFWREQYDGPSALVRVAPLQADHDATYVDGESPPGRDSLHAGRWAVVTGGTASAPVPERACTLQLETVTVGSTADYPTRDAMLAAAERNGF